MPRPTNQHTVEQYALEGVVIDPGEHLGWTDVFLVALRQCGNVTKSAAIAGVSRFTAYETRDRYPVFAADWADAMEEVVDNVEMRLTQDALNGNTTAQIFFLKAHREEYRDKVEFVQAIDLSKLTEQQLREVAMTGKLGP